MKKVLAIGLALAFVSVSAFAETDAKAIKKINDIRKGLNTKNAIIDLRVLDDAQVGGNFTNSGDVFFGSNVTVQGDSTFNGNVTIETNSAASPIQVFADTGSTNKGVVVYWNKSVATNADANSTLTFNWFRMFNDSSELLDYGRTVYKVTSPTTNAEGSSAAIYIWSSGTLTEQLLIDTNGVTVGSGSWIGNGNQITNIPGSALTPASVLTAVDIRAVTNGSYAALNGIPFTFAVTNDVAGGTNNQVTYYTNGLVGSVTRTIP